MKLSQKISSVLHVLCIVGIGAFFSYFHTGIPYKQYQNLWDYRRLHPDIIPSKDALNILSIGHQNLYADVMWIQLVQFIGDNIRNESYTTFTHKILSGIQLLHPRFTRPYELDVLLLPSVSSLKDPVVLEKDKIRLQDGLADIESSYSRICDRDKIQKINELGFGDELWSREDLKNPCTSGYTAYYLATRYDTDLLNKKKAAYYYKIASMHADAPAASRFLGILAYSNSGNYRDGALSFALIGISGFDNTEGLLCHAFATELVQELSQKIPWTKGFIDALEKKSTSIGDPVYDPLQGTSCYESVERALKQIYIGYITDITKDKPDLANGDELIQLHILDHIPVPSTMSGFTVVKRKGIWQYQKKYN